MADALTLVNGIPRMTSIAAGGGSLTVKDQGTTIDTDVSVIDFTGSPATASQTAPGEVEVAIAGVAVSEPAIYDETIDITQITPAGTAITLPNSQTYEGDELEVWYEGQRVDVTRDFNYVGSGSKTQITFVEDLMPGDTIRLQ